MKSSRTCTLAAVAIIALGASNASANWLANPSFEAPITSDGSPFVGFWEGFSGTAGATASNSSLMPRTGTGHGQLAITNSNNSFAGVFQDVVGLVPGQITTFSGWNKTVSAPLDLGAELRIEWRKVGQQSAVSRTPNTIPVLTFNYTPFSITTTVPAGADSARVVYAVQTFGPEPTNSGTVYIDDFSFILEGVPGDYNHDGTVDAADYVAWRKTPAAFGGNPAGYNNWRTNFGDLSGSGGSNNAVPEPSAIVQIGALLLLMIARPRLREEQRLSVQSINLALPSALL